MEIKRVSSAMHPGEAVTAGSIALTSEVGSKNPGAFRSGQITQKNETLLKRTESQCNPPISSSIHPDKLLLLL